MNTLFQIEKELQKRLTYPYHWGRKQSDDWDRRTSFIYQTQAFEVLLDRIKDLPQEVQNYAMNRWYNFWSAMAVEQLFSQHQKVVANTNRYDKLIDFTIDGIAFDHKTSVFPRTFSKELSYAQRNEEELIQWFYNHQSQEGRKHLKNRIFVVLYDKKHQHHWKLKADISGLQSIVSSYLQTFSERHLKHIYLGIDEIYSDIIWFVK